jgi:modulator of FtsH protease
VTSGGLVNNPAHWTNFAIALAGVGAVLAGLVFVALSVNLERILQLPGLPGRAGETVIVLIGAVVQCAFLLIPGLDRVALGVSLLLVGGLEWAIVTAVSVTGARQQTAEPRSWNVARVAYVQIATIPVAVAGFLVLINASGALYWLAGAVLWAVVAASGNAWVLIVEVARDVRYLPLDEKRDNS